MEMDDHAWEKWWREMLEHARTRPAMYIGGRDSILIEPMRLVWQAKVFRRPQRVRVDLSPHQCVIRCDTGPLIRPVQQMFSFPGGRMLGDAWEDERRDYFARLWEEEKRNPKTEYRPWRGWRRCFTCSTGPRLSWAAVGTQLARRLTWGIRTNQGLWCQAYEGGWPSGAPFLIEGDSPVGLFVIADLDPQFWIGLPYNEMDVDKLREMSHKPQGLDQRWKPEPAWSTGAIVANWHDADTLVTEKSLTAEGVRQSLSPEMDLRASSLSTNS